MTLAPDDLNNEGDINHARARWYLEIVYILALYALYSVVRNVQGSNLSETTAMRNAFEILDLQNALRLISEIDVQQFFLPYEWFIKFLNVYYGSAHFVVTIGVLVWLFTHQVSRYVHWRNIIFMTSGLALIGYIAYPLAPPRLLPNEFGFVDTLQTVGGLWSFENENVQSISNQYAAMPSLHSAWALWSAFAIMPVLRRWWSRVLISLYPALTVLTIVVTGNHYWLDVVGGVVVFAGGYVIANYVEGVRKRRKTKAGLVSAV